MTTFAAGPSDDPEKVFCSEGLCVALGWGERRFWRGQFRDATAHTTNLVASLRLTPVQIGLALLLAVALQAIDPLSDPIFEHDQVSVANDATQLYGKKVCPCTVRHDRAARPRRIKNAWSRSTSSRLRVGKVDPIRLCASSMRAWAA